MGFKGVSVNFSNGSGTDRPVVTAGPATTGDSAPLVTAHVSKAHPEAGPAVADVAFTQPDAPAATPLPLVGHSGEAVRDFLGLGPDRIDPDHLERHGVKVLPGLPNRRKAWFRLEALLAGERSADGFKAFLRRGYLSLRRLADSGLGRMSRFAAVGAFGTVLNLAIMAVMIGLGAHYLPAAIVATELTIVSNFLMQERLVFRDVRQSRPLWQRFLAGFGFNNLETLVRIPVLMLLVEVLAIPGVLAQAVTLAVAFLARFTFTSRFIYRVRPSAGTPVPGSTAPMTPAGVEVA